MHFSLVYHISKDFQVTCYVFPYVSVGVMYQGVSDGITMLSRQRVSWLPAVRSSPKASSFHHPFNSPFLRFPHPQPHPFVYGMWLCFTWADVWALPGQTDLLLLTSCFSSLLMFLPSTYTPLAMSGLFLLLPPPRSCPCCPTAQCLQGWQSTAFFFLSLTLHFPPCFCVEQHLADEFLDI